ncbi:unnamed protein product, partial [Iphiclides podalirius]
MPPVHNCFELVVGEARHDQPTNQTGTPEHATRAVPRFRLAGPFARPPQVRRIGKGPQGQQWLIKPNKKRAVAA